MVEEWRDIPGWEGYYQASNLGRIRSVDRIITVHNQYANSKRFFEGHILKPSIVRGYYRVNLCMGSKSKNIFVHRLVALAFIPKIKGKLHVNHIDGNKLNNNFDNLEWVTPSENMQHARKMGLRKILPIDRENIKIAAPFAWEKHRMFSDYDIRKIFSLRSNGLTHAKIADKMHCYQSQITRILNRKCYTHVSIQED